MHRPAGLECPSQGQHSHTHTSADASGERRDTERRHEPPVAPSETCAAFTAGPPPVSHEFYQHQLRLYSEARKKLNILMPFETYYNTFGPLSEQNKGYGDRVFDGMMVLLAQYPFNYLMTGQVYCGWFALPDPFSRDQAAKPRTDMETNWYPTVFVGDDTDEFKRIACENMLIKKTKPWWVHESRVQNFVVAGFLRHAV